MTDAKIVCGSYPSCVSECPCDIFIDLRTTFVKCKNTCEYKYDTSGVECNKSICPCGDYQVKSVA